ncbi:MAG: hypothetical protein IPK48_14565 [Gammaproteobacteria bacterium]|nr:hypothetical protein [Gammaproteobacteria bacterium]
MARAPNISEINVPFMAFPLFQIGQCRAKVDVKGLAIDDERWHRLDACRLGFSNTGLLFARDDLDGIAGDSALTNCRHTPGNRHGKTRRCS